MDNKPGFDIVPFRIRIGVTGHRTLPNTELLASAVDEILNTRYREVFTLDTRRALGKANSTPVAFTVVSPLAEGADRLVARVVLAHGGLLMALLPLAPEEYRKDFTTEGSRQEFDDLLARAHRKSIVDCSNILDRSDYRRQAYRRVGEEMLKRCDILIAIWNGKKPQNECGAGAITTLALKKNKPVFILSTALSGSVELRNGGTLSGH